MEIKIAATCGTFHFLRRFTRGLSRIASRIAKAKGDKISCKLLNT